MKLREEGDFLRAWGGIASLQLGLPAVWTEARSRGYALTRHRRSGCARSGASGRAQQNEKERLPRAATPIS